MALTKDRNVPSRAAARVSHPVKGGVVLFAGALVVLDGGFASPGHVAPGLTAIGRAEFHVDNSNGGDGDVRADIKREGAFRFENLATDLVDRSHIGRDCYIVDDCTVAATAGGDPATRSRAGRVVDVDDDGVWVEFR